MAKEDDQRLKDMMRAIELGEIEEDILEGDPEDYEDMGGINSLKKGAPSIKMASETPEEEFELELGTVIKEYNDLKEQGLIRDISIEEYIDKYLSKKRSMNKKIALGEGYKSPELNSMSMSMFGKPVKLLTPDEMDQLRQAYDDAKGRTEAMYGGRMQYAGGSDDYNPGKMGNPAVMTKIENMREERIMNPDVEDVADYLTYYKKKKKQDDDQDIPIKKEGDKLDLDIEKIKKLIENRKKEKAKRAKGGIAGVL
jgi:hypothetical protein